MTLLDAVKLAYRKHVLDDQSITQEYLDQQLSAVLYTELGAEAYCEWRKKADKQIKQIKADALDKGIIR